MDEIWKPIPRYEGIYEVSNCGKIRSLDRWVARKNQRSVFIPGIERACPPNDRGYPQTSLHKEGKAHTVRVHPIVADVFIGPRPCGMQICHNDGNRANNRADNLRYDTITANHRDKVDHGTVLQGSRSYQAKLTEEIVSAIRKLPVYPGMTRDLCEQYNTSCATISNARLGKTWKHVT